METDVHHEQPLARKMFLVAECLERQPTETPIEIPTGANKHEQGSQHNTHQQRKKVHDYTMHLKA